tara:strand:+ start:151 stop:339 length:189 start_codon:yes stop_codon:yes gene_type:complete
MTATKAQYRSANDILEKNPSMQWDGKFGFYSNGQCVMTIWWDFDETKEKFKLTINPDGSQDY